MSACMSGTYGSGVLSSTGDVLVRGVGGVCDMRMCLARAVWVGTGGEGGEWMRAVGWCYVCVSLDSLCRWQVQVSVYCA